jgi:AcrR family transcriptional regulator
MVKASAPITRDQRREAIIHVARELFFERGYIGTSMSAIAARLGGSKGALYTYFKNKKDLFDAQVRDLCDTTPDHLLEIDVDRPPAEMLTSLGVDYVQTLFAADTVKLSRILIAEAQRSPELGRLFYEVGPERGRKGIAVYLEALRARGILNPSNCTIAAEQFLSLCKGTVHLRFMLNLIPSLTHEEICRQVAQAVIAFMGAYGQRKFNG